MADRPTKYVRFIGSGPWSVVRGPWSVVRGPLSVVRCPLRVVRGAWCVVCCPLSVVRCPLSVVRGPLSVGSLPVAMGGSLRNDESGCPPETSAFLLITNNYVWFIGTHRPRVINVMSVRINQPRTTDHGQRTTDNGPVPINRTYFAWCSKMMVGNWWRAWDASERVESAERAETCCE